MKQAAHLRVVGRLKITNADSGQELLNQTNAIHGQNFAFAVVRALSNEPNGVVSRLCLGDGGTFLNSSSVLTFRLPNSTGEQADLYSQTYEQLVDDQAAGVSPSNFTVPVAPVAPSITSTVLVNALLTSTDPTNNPAVTYTFDEVGLKTADGLLLTHIIFTPIDKTTAQTFLITYTLEVSAA